MSNSSRYPVPAPDTADGGRGAGGDTLGFIGRLRTLASDAAIYSLPEVAIRFLNFLLTPLYTNLLAPGELGPVSTLYSYIAFARELYILGLEQAYLRFAPPGEKRDPRAVFSTATSVLLLGGLSLSGLLAVLRRPIAATVGLAGLGDYIAAGAAILLLDTLQALPFAYFRLHRKPRAYAVVRGTVLVANIVLTVLFLLVWRHGAFGLLEANLLSSALGLLLVLPVYEKLYRPRLDRRLLGEMLAFGLPLVPSGLSALVIQVADRPILQLLTDDYTVGVYQANYRLGILMMLLVTVFRFAWQPFFLTRSGDADAPQLFARVLTYYLALALGAFLAVAMSIDRLVRIPIGGGRHLIAPDYWTGLPVVPWVLLGYVALGIYTNLAAGPTIRKQTRVFPWITGLAAGANIGLNLWLVPRFGYIAAAWTTLIAYLLMAGGMGFAARRIYPVPYEWGRLLRVVAVSAAVWGGFVALGGAGLGIAPRLGLLSLYPGLLLLSGFLSGSETAALRRLLRRPAP